MGDSTTTQSSNLARIRDNQRRSRARRKEYLQELENKYRNCEQLGVFASAEIQAAARRVAAENNRLRAILRTKGVSEKEIDAFTGGQDGDNGNTQSPSAAQTLAILLTERRPCNGEAMGKTIGSGAPAEQKKDGNLQRTALETQQQQRSSVGSIAMESISHSPRLTRASSLVATPNSPSFSLINSTTEIGPPHLQARENHFPHNQLPHQSSHPQEYLQPQQYQQQEHEYPEYYNTTHIPPWQQPPSILYSSSINNGIVDHGDLSSCTFAADVLRGMVADVSQEELHEQLGCTAAATDCDVNNRVLFDVMDRYTSGRRPGRI